jgi:hypothetical protein
MPNLLRSVPLLAQTDRADCLPACVEITNTLYPSKTRLRLGSEFLLHQAGMGMPVYGISIRDDQLAHAAQLHLIGAEAGGQ